MSTPVKRARYALHTPRLALRIVVVLFLFVSWALYIHRSVKCEQILGVIRHEKNLPKNLPSNRAVCWDQKNSGALRPFLLVSLYFWRGLLKAEKRC
jgi:4-amino-4-deoxy-L-arabinose transferase-like glycosyltransferase